MHGQQNIKKMFRTVPLSIIRSFFTVHTAMVYVIQVCWQLASRIRTEMRFRPDPARKLYDIFSCCVYSGKLLMMDRGTVREHVEFYFKNKLEKLVHLVGFIIRLYVKLSTFLGKGSVSNIWVEEGGCTANLRKHAQSLTKITGCHTQTTNTTSAGQ